MLRQILEDCRPGFAEVVLMLSNSSSSAEVYTTFDDLRFTPDGNIVTFMADGGTHLHLKMDTSQNGPRQESPVHIYYEPAGPT